MGVNAGHRERLFLAVEVGLLATDAILVDPEGEVLARATSGGSSPRRVGAVRTVDTLVRLRGAVVVAAGLAEDQVLERIGVFISGVDLPSERVEMRAAVQARFPSSELIIENDTHAVLWAGMRRPAGAAVFCGDGINAIARSATGKTSRYLALGMVSGEWGGALTLGREALSAASRAEDGRGPDTLLRYLVAAHLSRPTVREAVAHWHSQGADEGALASVADTVFTADAEGDDVARGLVRRLVNEIVGMTRAALERALVPPSGSDVVLAGWMLTDGYESFNTRVDQLYREVLPGAAVSRLDLPLVAGAALACISADYGGTVSGALRSRLSENILSSVAVNS